MPSPITKRQRHVLRAILTYLRRYHAPCSQGDIARILKIHPRTVRHHLALLQPYLHHHRAGKQGGYTLTQLACQLLKAEQPFINPKPPSRRIRNNRSLVGWINRRQREYDRLSAQHLSNSTHYNAHEYHIPIAD